MRLLPLALLAVLAAGCTLPAQEPPPPTLTPAPEPEVAAWTRTACPLALADATPPLLVARAPHGDDPDSRLLRLEAGPDGWAEAARSEAALATGAGSSGVVTMGDHMLRFGMALGDDGAVYAHAHDPDGNGTRLVRLDRDLRVTASAPVRSFGAMAFHDGLLYVAGANLTVYDGDLRALGDVELPLKEWGGGKVAHDVIVHDGLAYLLDDVVMPLYVLRADVRDPARPLVTERISMTTVGGHLPMHWLDPERGGWVVIQSYGHRGGSGQNAVVLPLEGEEERVTVLLSRSVRFPNETREGLHLAAALRGPPLWAMAGWHDGAWSLGRLALDPGEARVSFCDALSVPPMPPEAGGTSLAREGDLVVGHRGGWVFAVGTGQDPAALLHAQDLGMPVLGALPAPP